MTTPDEHDGPDEESQPKIHLAFQTPVGFFSEGADLPPEIREALVSQFLADDSIPVEIREALSESLGVTIEEAKRAPHVSLAIQAHREQLWDLLDSAFPNDPHLWNAGEALFTMSAKNPATVDDDGRLAALESANHHLRRHAARLSPEVSPQDQLIADFREQMDGI